MGMGKNLLLLAFCLSFSMWAIAGIGTPFLQAISCMQDPGSQLVAPGTNVTSPSGMTVTATSSCQTIAGVQLNLYTILFGVIGTLIATALISIFVQKFPDPYTMFAPAGLFLLTMLTFPTGLFNSTPSNWIPLELKLFIGGFFMIAYLLSFLEFYKGGSF
jgi:hypothetical protein